MGFADTYIEKRVLFHPFIQHLPSADLRIIVVIPCFNEPDIEEILNDLRNCSPTISPVEIIIHVNSPANSQKDISDQNEKTYSDLQSLLPEISESHKQFYVIFNSNLPEKHAGAGLARKIVMDEAIHRFNSINRPDGIIVSIDADTRCNKNFLSEIERHYDNNPGISGSNVYFEHPLKGNKFKKEIYEAIIKYELYLRYYRQCIKFTRYPYSFHTIGSTFNIKASVYTSQGGMNKKKAGEDFYFLQKIFPLGNFSEINTTTLYPSPRPSDRVPFGTGPAISQIIANDMNLNTYTFESFLLLKMHFSNVPALFGINDFDLRSFLERIPEPLRSFLINTSFELKVKEINENCANNKSFVKRYFRWFNSFQILKYLNHSHKDHFRQIPVKKASDAYFLMVHNKITSELSDMESLHLFREIERG